MGVIFYLHFFVLSENGSGICIGVFAGMISVFKLIFIHEFYDLVRIFDT